MSREKKLSSFFSNNLGSGHGALTNLQKELDILKKRVKVLEEQLKGLKDVKRSGEN